MSEQLELDIQDLFTGLSITLEEEMGLFAHRINVEIRRMRRAGLTDKAIYDSLLVDAQMGGRLFGRFETAVKGHLYNGVQDASVIGEQEVYAAHGIDTAWEQWMVVSSDTGPCPNCAVREGDILTHEQWIDVGLPGTGWSVCKGACRCRLVPAELMK